MIEYASMETIKALLGDMLYLKCAKREYCASCRTRRSARSGRRTSSSSRSAPAAVPGYVVMPPEAMPAPDPEKEQEA